MAAGVWPGPGLAGRTALPAAARLGSAAGFVLGGSAGVDCSELGQHLPLMAVGPVAGTGRLQW